ncbi:MAG: helicase HerA-like domain-containing protein [Candidatus Woesearchaeota archaeon]
MNKNPTFRILERDRQLERRRQQLYILLGILGVLLAVGVILLIRMFIGYAVLESRAGTITQLNIQLRYSTHIWAGFYGLAFRVPGYTEQQSAVAVGGTVFLQHLVFDCLKTTDGNIPEVYASTSRNIDWNSLQPATPDLIDSYLQVDPSDITSASNTFTETMSILLGDREITNIAATHTKKFGVPDSTDFDIGFLKDSLGNLVFVTHVTPTYTKGFNNQTINYQMLLPVQAGTAPVYYFFSDPYDECQAGLEALKNATIFGRAIDNATGLPLENVTVNLHTATVLTNSTGDYYIAIFNGTYTLVAFKPGYYTFVATNITLPADNLSTPQSENIVEFNISLIPNPGNPTGLGNLTGTVTDKDFGIPLYNVTVYVNGRIAKTNITGQYLLELPAGNHSLIAMKENYRTYYTPNVTILPGNTTEFNFSMEYAEPEIKETPGYPLNTFVSNLLKQAVQRPQIILTHKIDTKEIFETLKVGSYVQRSFNITSYRPAESKVEFEVIGSAAQLVKVDKSSSIIPPRGAENFTLTILANVPPGIYTGTFLIKGDLEDRIPIKIVVYEKDRLPIEALLLEVVPIKKIISPGELFEYKVSMTNLLRDTPYNITLSYNITSRSSNLTIPVEEETRLLETQLSYLKYYKLPKDLPEGEYFLETRAEFLELSTNTKSLFIVKKPIYMYALFGILPLWQLFIIIVFTSLMTFAGLMYRKRVLASRRYGVSVDLRSFPSSGRLVRLGKLAEYGRDFWFDLDGLTTHCIVAGATGGGKTVAAQVLVEEALKAGVAVVVFDPTAQWSGFLRPCSDKGMLSLYSGFGLRRSDARGFPGNVRQVLDAREVFDVRRFMRPGEIEILSLNRLRPEEIDVFVANTVRSVFDAGLDECRELRLLLVYDEVHRLLPRFGGSGEGFVQIERACREFRKWGVGVVLISQVLSDFVGEIKANINTEVQMRTRDEGDLERIRVKYGDAYLRGLVRASVGTGMFENPGYNGGRPFFVSFRPLLHSVVRLSDAELGEYNRLNGVLDDLEFWIGELERLGVDVFDLRLELKLAWDKLRVGGFGMVDVYVEGLRPRVLGEFERLGRPVPKREVKRLSDEELQKEKEIAMQEHEKAKQQEAGQTSQNSDSKTETSQIQNTKVEEQPSQNEKAENQENAKSSNENKIKRVREGKKQRMRKSASSEKNNKKRGAKK